LKRASQPVRIVRTAKRSTYLCLECRRTFTALSGTPLNRLHKRSKWLQQAKALEDGLTLHEVANALNIHVSTAHRWRHRFLKLPELIQPPALTGIAEADETVFLLSFKGRRSGLDRKARKRGGRASKPGMCHEQVPVLVARDRAGATMNWVLAGVNTAALVDVLKPFIAQDVVLCTDGSKALGAAARELGVEHHAVNLSAGVRVDECVACSECQCVSQSAQSMDTEIPRRGHSLPEELPGLVSSP
jgi:transposase-like protein